MLLRPFSLSLRLLLQEAKRQLTQLMAANEHGQSRDLNVHLSTLHPSLLTTRARPLSLLTPLLTPAGRKQMAAEVKQHRRFEESSMALSKEVTSRYMATPRCTVATQPVHTVCSHLWRSRRCAPSSPRRKERSARHRRTRPHGRCE